MPASWSAVEQLLQAWVASASGIPAIWSHQSVARPELPFATLKHDGGSSKGIPERDLSYDSQAPAGQEITISTREHTEFAVSVQVFTADVVGDNAAPAILNRVRNALGLEGQVNAFAVQSLAMVDRGTVQNLTDLLETRFEGRASLDVRFRVSDGAADKTGYIATVGPITGTTTE